MPFSIRPGRRLPLAYVSGFWFLIMLLVLSNGPGYAELRKLMKMTHLLCTPIPTPFAAKGIW